MKDFRLYFGGAEQQGWRRLLAEQGAPMAVSFKGLLRRMPNLRLKGSPESLTWRPGLILRGLKGLPVEF